MSRFLLSAGLLLTVLLAGCGTSASGASVAASVNGTDISRASFNKQLKYKRVVSSDSYGMDVCAQKSTAALCNELKRETLNGMIDDEIARQYAEKHHISVSDAEFNREWTIVLKKSFTGQTRVARSYARRYGWTLADLKSSIRQDLLGQKVAVAVTQGMSTTALALSISRIDVANAAQAQQVEAQLRGGTAFNAIARQLNVAKNSTCHKQGGCGPMGWIPSYFLSPAHRAALLAARPGQVLGPFQAQRVLEFLQIEAKNPSFAMTSQQIYQRRQQLYSAWLQRQRQSASIKRYVTV